MKESFFEELIREIMDSTDPTKDEYVRETSRIQLEKQEQEYKDWQTNHQKEYEEDLDDEDFYDLDDEDLDDEDFYDLDDEDLDDEVITFMISG